MFFANRWRAMRRVRSNSLPNPKMNRGDLKLEEDEAAPVVYISNWRNENEGKMELVMRKRDVNSYRNSEFNTLERALKLSPEQNTRSERASTRPITRAKHSGKHSSKHPTQREQNTSEHSSQHSRNTRETHSRHAHQHTLLTFEFTITA